VAVKESGEKQIFGITIGIFALVVVVVGVFIFFSVRRLGQIRAETEKYEAARKASQVVADKKKDKEREKKETEARTADCNEYLPKDDDVERTLLSLSGRSKDAGLDSTSLKKEVQSTAGRPGQNKTSYETIRYKGDFEGTFHQLARFVGSVENWETSRRFVNITAFAMDSDSKGMAYDDGVQKHKIRMTLELYKYQYQEKAATPAGPATPGAPAGQPAK